MRGVSMLSQHKITANYAFIVGLPFETRKEIYETLSLIMKIKRMHPQAEFSYLYYRPYPGGDLYAQAIEYGYRPPSTLEGWINFQDEETGFASLDSLPWIKNKEFIKYLLFAVPHSTRNIRNQRLLSSVALFTVKIFFKISLYLRTKFQFESFIFELKFWNSLRAVRRILRKVSISLMNRKT